MKKFKPHKPPKISYRPSLIQQGTSREELELHNTIRLILPGVQTFRSDRVILHGREIDILIPSYKIGIEFNGLRFHSGDDKSKGYHLWKTEEAEKAGYRLIHIWSDLWENRRAQTVNYLSKLFNKVTVLQSEDVLEISPQEGSSFIEATHILGNDLRANKYFGIFYEGSLVVVASFLQEDDKWTLLRISERKSLKVENELSLIISYIERKYKADQMLAEEDRSLFNGRDLPGFKIKSYTSPQCYWTKDYKTRRLQESNTVEQLKRAGYNQFYDCGKIILEKSPHL